MSSSSGSALDTTRIGSTGPARGSQQQYGAQPYGSGPHSTHGNPNAGSMGGGGGGGYVPSHSSDPYGHGSAGSSKGPHASFEHSSSLLQDTNMSSSRASAHSVNGRNYFRDCNLSKDQKILLTLLAFTAITATFSLLGGFNAIHMPAYAVGLIGCAPVIATLLATWLLRHSERERLRMMQ